MHTQLPVSWHCAWVAPLPDDLMLTPLLVGLPMEVALSGTGEPSDARGGAQE